MNRQNPIGVSFAYGGLVENVNTSSVLGTFLLRGIFQHVTLSMRPNAGRKLSTSFDHLLRSILLAILCSSQLGFAIERPQQNSVTISHSDEQLDLNAHLWFYEDQSGQLTIENMLDSGQLHEFSPTDKRSPNFGFSDSSWWARVPLQNVSGKSLTAFIVESYAVVDKIDFWLVNPTSGASSHILMGDKLPNDPQRKAYRFPSFPIELLEGNSWLFMRIRTQGSVIFNVSLYQEASFYETKTNEYVLLYSCLGILAVMGLYNFLIWLQLRKSSYLIYFFFIVSMVAQNLAFCGLAVHLFDDYTWFMNIAYIVTANFSVLFALLFALVFLSLRGRHPWLERLCYLGIFLSFSSTICVVFSYNLGGKVSVLSATMASVITLTCGTVCSLKRFRPAYFFTFAWLTLIIGNVIRMAMLWGYLPSSFWAENSVLVGSVIEVILLSLALADKVRITEKLAFESIENLNQNLEKTVAEQTSELRVKNQTLIEKTQAIEHVNDELKELDNSKMVFFRQISHELRTPLTLILGSLHFLDKENGRSEVRTALSNAKRLLRLVNQLLDFQRLTQHRGDESADVIDLRSIVLSISEAFYDACREHNTRIEVQDRIPQTETPWVKGKIDSLEKILFNYIANALKYTPAGGQIKIVLETHAGKVKVTVEDTGPGIEPEQLNSLFQVYKRLADRNGQWREGSGIGLALCKELAASMQGEVGVSSRVGMGSSFWASFPLSSRDQVPSALMDVLFIDDEVSIQTDFAQAIGRSSDLDHIVIVSSFEEAEKKLRSNRFRCVIADLNLNSERGNGVDILTLAYQLYPDSVRIVISGDRSGEKLQIALDQARISTILFKPFRWDTELEKIEALIRKSPMQHDVVLDQAAQRERSELHLATLEIDKIPVEAPHETVHSGAPLILIVDDLPEMRQLVRRILSQKPFRFLECSDGKEAWQVLQADQAIDLVISDWMMPKMSGPELIEAVRGHETLQSMPIVLLTAKGDDHSRQIGLQHGANAYLGKPFDSLELLSTVSNLINLKQKEKELVTLQKHVMEHVLKRYLPAGLVQRIVEGSSNFDDAPTVKSVTIMFVDICDFTKSSENLGAKKIGSILNSYFTAMSRVIFEHHGTIDKFIGDGIMVVFGAPEDLPINKQVSSAKECAISMFEQLRKLNEVWAAQNLPQFRMRLGIHHGPAIVGSFGGAERSDYTVIGSTVNLASRIQSAALPDSIFVSSIIRDYLEDEQLENMGYFELKGVMGKQHLFSIRLTAKDLAA